MTDETRYELSRCSAAQIWTSSDKPSRYRLLRVSSSAGSDDNKDVAVISTFNDTPLWAVQKDSVLRADNDRCDDSIRVSGEFDTLKCSISRSRTSSSIGAAIQRRH